MIKRLTFQERALERSRLAHELLEAIEMYENNPSYHGTAILELYQIRVMKRVVNALLQMK